MYPWNCCRTCLSSQNLHPIFSEFGNAEKYSESVFIATGIKVDPNDHLPQQMCSICIDFINKCKEFRKKAIKSHEELLERLQSSTGDHNIVLLPENNYSKSGEIKLEMFLQKDDYFSDDDDVTLDQFKSMKNTETNTSQIKSAQDNTVQCNGEFNSENIEKSITEKKTVKRKPRTKKTETEDKSKGKKERVKETIECEICHKILTSKLSIRNHYKIHTGFDVVCEHCGKKFITRRLLMQHCRAKHGYEKTDKCSYCDYRASNAEQVKIHERLHTGEKPYKCGDCADAFHRRSSYLQHIATHLKEKTVQCTECPKQFKSATLMHIHRHHRHRPPSHSFRCEVCGRSFARRRNVTRHVALLHRADAARSVRRVRNLP